MKYIEGHLSRCIGALCVVAVLLFLCGSKNACGAKSGRLLIVWSLLLSRHVPPHLANFAHRVCPALHGGTEKVVASAMMRIKAGPTCSWRCSITLVVVVVVYSLNRITTTTHLCVCVYIFVVAAAVLRPTLGRAILPVASCPVVTAAAAAV